jgi:hypothetical protein
MDRHSPDHWFAPVLQAGLCNDPAVLNGLSQRLVVTLVLVCVGTGEIGHGLVEDIAVAQVGRDGNPVARAGVGAGEGCCADARIIVITEGLMVSMSAEPFQSRSCRK